MDLESEILVLRDNVEKIMLLLQAQQYGKAKKVRRKKVKDEIEDSIEKSWNKRYPNFPFIRSK